MDGDRVMMPADTGVSRRELMSGAPVAAAGLGATFALAAQPVQAQTMIVTPSDGLTAGEVKVNSTVS
jgi:carboxymethylenebutenolidase